MENVQMNKHGETFPPQEMLKQWDNSEGKFYQNGRDISKNKKK